MVDEADAPPRKPDAGDAYLAALARLRANDPNDKELKVKAKAGTLRISISSVAKEAKRSRGPIAVKDSGSRYFNIHMEIRNSSGLVVATKAGRKPKRLTAQGTIFRLRRDLAQVVKERDLLAQKRSIAVDTARDLEKRLREAEKELKKLRKAENQAADEKYLAERGKPKLPAVPELPHDVVAFPMRSRIPDEHHI